MLTVRECSSMAILRIHGAGPVPPGAGTQVIVPAKAEPAARAKKAWRANRMGLDFMLGTARSVDRDLYIHAHLSHKAPRREVDHFGIEAPAQIDRMIAIEQAPGELVHVERKNWGKSYLKAHATTPLLLAELSRVVQKRHPQHASGRQNRVQERSLMEPRHLSSLRRRIESIPPLRPFLRFLSPFLSLGQLPHAGQPPISTRPGSDQTSTMNYRRLGKTGLLVSQVGFGTCQLRLVPRQQALDTLSAGFELGVNVVHTAADYGGAIEIVAEAVRNARRPIYVCSNGWGSTESFEAQFEQSLALFGRTGSDGKKRLDIFGIASVEDRLILGDDVWGKHGQVAFLQRKKQEGVLRNSFCTTHGSPEFIADLIRSGSFDAIMFAYNPLGHHALTYKTPPDRDRENLIGNGELFELAAAHDVGVLLMEVLGGGLICESKAFGDRVQQLGGSSLAAVPRPSATEVLHHLLQSHSQIASLLPGTASVAEAEENAMAGHTLDRQDCIVEPQALLPAALNVMSTSLCTRCGVCEPLCSNGLKVSWLFRASDIERTGAMTFETPLYHHYFDFHPESNQSTCSSCEQRTCSCPSGIDIAAQLEQRHHEMMLLRRRRIVPGATQPFDPTCAPQWAADLMSRTMEDGQLRIAVRNMGWHGWHRASQYPQLSLALRSNSMDVTKLEIGDDVPAGAVFYCGITLEGEIPIDSIALFLVINNPDGNTTEMRILERNT